MDGGPGSRWQRREAMVSRMKGIAGNDREEGGRTKLIVAKEIRG